MTENTNINASNGPAMHAAFTARGLEVPKPPRVEQPDGFPILADAAFYGPLGAVVEEIAPETEAHPGAMLLQLLCAFGNAVGRGPRLEVGGIWHDPKVNVLVVGRTSKGRKGTSWTLVKRVLDHADQTWADTRILGGLSTGEGLIAQVGDPKDEDAPPTDKRLLIREGEWERVLAASGRDQATLSAIIRDAYDTSDLNIINRTNPIKVKGAHISIIGHITPAALAEKTPKIDLDNGMLNRFLYAHVERVRKLPRGGNLGPSVYERHGFELRRRLQTARQKPRLFATDEVLDKWVEIYDVLDDQLDAHPSSAVSGVASRGESLILRLALIYALADGDSEVNMDHLNAAMAVWDYSRSSVIELFGQNAGTSMADRLLAGLRANGGRLSRTEISRDVFNNHATVDQLDAVLGSMKAQGRITEEKVSSTGGAPRTDWILLDPEEVGQ